MKEEELKEIEAIIKGCEIDPSDPRNMSAAIMMDEMDGVHFEIWNGAIAEVLSTLKRKYEGNKK